MGITQWVTVLPDDEAPLPNESEGLGLDAPLPKENVAFSLVLALDRDPNEKLEVVAGAPEEPLEEPVFKKSKLGLFVVAAVSADDLNPPKPAKILGPPS